ncbi:hemicentin-1-like [Salvelinus alpinus]|uniref:hemicentin-1-like n=1 Tax=Salvelinus alpinus TaxID=8036 RepID=UPI0039FD1F33
MALRTTGSVLVVFLWSLTVVLGQDGWRVKYTPQSICTLKGSTVEMSCSYTYPRGYTVTTTLWFTKIYAGGNPVSLSDDPDYIGRVMYHSDKKNDHTLRITDLRDGDSATYKFSYITDRTVGKYTGDPGVSLSVTALQVKVTPIHRSQWKTLTCRTTSCHLTGNPTYTWYKNGKIVTEKTSPYSVLPNAKDSYSCAVKGHEDLHSPAVCVQDQSCNRVTYTKRTICVLKGSTVDISCTYVGYYSTISTFWFRSDKLGPEDLTRNPEYLGRALTRSHTTLRISDLREEDSAEYRFTYKKWNFEWCHSFPGTTLSVTDLKVKVTPAAEGQKTLTCSTTCTLTDNPDPTYIWYKNGQRLDEPTSQQHSSNLLVVWDSSVNSYSCAVEGQEGLHSPVVCFQVKLTPTRRATSKTLTCSTTCILTGNPTYIWYKNGQIITDNTSPYSVYSNAVDSYSCAVKGHEDLHSPAVCVQGQSCSRVTYTKRRICVLKGSTVDISCTYDSGYHTVTSSLWFSTNQRSRWRDKSIPEDLTRDPGYAGRVKYPDKERWRYKDPCILRITDLREEDSAEYRFTFKTYNFKWGHSFPGTTLSVTGLQVKVTPAAEGQKTLTCSTTCTLTDSPNPTYIWYKNGQVVTEKMSLYAVLPNAVDSYYCAVKGHEDLHSPAVYKPKTTVSVRPSGEIVEGSSVTLTCSSDANPPVDKYTWYKKNGGEYQSMTGPQHVFSQIQSSDTGEYYCESQNEMGTDRSRTINMNVKYGPKNTSVSVSPSGEIVEGSSVTLTCSSDANPPVDKYTWYKKNGASLTGSEKTYNFTTISSEDSGEYYCEAENKYGRLNSSSVSVDVQYDPKSTSVSVSPSGEIVEGSSVTLTCSSDANPPVDKYTWYKKNGASLTGSEKTYNFTTISSEDSGEYYCEAENKYGRLNSSSVSVDVHYDPKNTSVSVSPSGEIVEGSSVTLTCSSDANPPVDKYTWYKKNGASLTGSEKTYNFTTISSEDSGEYYCEAENKYGRLNSSSVSVDVQYDPKNTSVSVSPSGEIVEGSSVTLTCSSDANPPVDKYTWYFQNKTFLNGFGQIYNISKFKSKDNGHYHCEAWNGRGSRNSTALMIILPGKQTSVLTAAVGIIVVVLVLILCFSGLMWFRKKASKSTSDTRDTSENVQGDSSPVYENVSSVAFTPTAAQTATTVDQDDVHYASVHFSRSKNQEVPLYSTIQQPQPQKQDEDVQYDAVKFDWPSNSNRPTAAQAAEEDSSVLYSRVNKP